MSLDLLDGENHMPSQPKPAILSVHSNPSLYITRHKVNGAILRDIEPHNPTNGSGFNLLA